jgi:hypothetical protein
MLKLGGGHFLPQKKRNRSPLRLEKPHTQAVLARARFTFPAPPLWRLSTPSAFPGHQPGLSVPAHRSIEAAYKRSRACYAAPAGWKLYGSKIGALGFDSCPRPNLGALKLLHRNAFTRGVARAKMDVQLLLASLGRSRAVNRVTLVAPADQHLRRRVKDAECEQRYLVQRQDRRRSGPVPLSWQLHQRGPLGQMAATRLLSGRRPG